MTDICHAGMFIAGIQEVYSLLRKVLSESIVDPRLKRAGMTVKTDRHVGVFIAGIQEVYSLLRRVLSESVVDPR
jgi:hypothetical protein